VGFFTKFRYSFLISKTFIFGSFNQKTTEVAESEGHTSIILIRTREGVSCQHKDVINFHDM